MILKIQAFLDNLGKTIVSFIRIFAMSKFGVSSHFQRNSDECILLGNGPSLETSLSTHPEILNNRQLICVNFFSITGFYEQTKPAGYIINAPEIWSNDLDQERRSRFNQVFEKIEEKTTWELVLFLPVKARTARIFKEKIKPLLSKNSNITISFFNPTPIEGFKSISYLLFRLNMGTPRPHNVFIPGLVITINLGFNKIFLLGADHSWLKEITVDNDNRVLVNQKHFYDKEDNTSKTMYNIAGGKRRLHEILMKLVYSFRGYFILREYAQKRGARIINATPDSYIDAFERYGYSG